MTTSEPPAPGGDPGNGHLFTLSPEASPASPLAKRVEVWRSRTPGGSGQPCSLSSRKYARSGSSQRTCPVCDGMALTLSSVLTFAESGIESASETPLLALWVPHTHAVGCSFWPTPKARDGARGGSSAEAVLRREKKTNSSVDLNDAVGGPPNPTWVEWLMGFPEGWTDVRPLGNAVVPAVAEHIGRLIMAGAA